MLQCCGADVRHVDHGVHEEVAIKDLTAAAPHQGSWFLRRQPLAGLPHRIFARGPIPLIVEAALRNRISSFVIDGEAVLLGVDGISDFNHSWKHDGEVQLYAFDILALDGEDLRKLPLHLRNLARLSSRCWSAAASRAP